MSEGWRERASERESERAKERKCWCERVFGSMGGFSLSGAHRPPADPHDAQNAPVIAAQIEVGNGVALECFADFKGHILDGKVVERFGVLAVPLFNCRRKRSDPWSAGKKE